MKSISPRSTRGARRKACLLLFFSVLPVFSVVQNVFAQTSPLIERATQVWQSGKPEQAAQMLDATASAGNIPAQMLMGEIREQSDTPETLLKARNWYARPALLDHAPAQFALHRVLLSPKLVEAATLPAAPLNTAILAGQTNNANAADYWLHRAANLGNAQAEYLLGQQFEATADMTQALYWYERAAKNNHPPALNTLAVLLWQGQAITRDSTRAIQLYRQAAERGDAPAMFNLAGLIAQGAAVGDSTEVLQWLHKAAAQGYGKAQLQLARMLLYGDQTEQNEKEAARWFRAAAEQNLGWAQYYLAILLQKGRGIRRDLEESQLWFERAARANIAPAQYELGLIYLNGFGVVSHPVKAKALLQQAADAGLPEARALLVKLNSTAETLASEPINTTTPKNEKPDSANRD